MAYTEEEARQRKNARQREYTKKTNFAAQKKYNEAHKDDSIFFTVRVTKSKDGDMLEFLEQFESRSGYVKQLIREDMERKNWHSGNES